MSRRWVVGTLIALAVVLLGGRVLAAEYVDFLWFSSMGEGALALWKVELENRAILALISSTMAILFLLANLYAVRQSVVSLVLPRRLANLEIGEEVPGRLLTQASVAISVVLGLLLTLPRRHWTQLAAARYGIPFRERDPVFEYDIGYYVHLFPLEKTLLHWSMLVLTVAAIVVFFLYALTPSLQWTRERGLQMTLYVRRHVGMLFALALLLLAWHFRLQILGMLFDGSGPEGLFTAADRGAVSARTGLAVVTLLAAFLFAWAMWTDQLRLALVCVTAVLLTSLGTTFLSPLFLAGTGNTATAGSAGEQYDAMRAGRTRRAFAVDDIITGEPRAAFVFASRAEAAAGIAVWDSRHFASAAVRRIGGGVAEGSPGYVPSPSGLLMRQVVAPENRSVERNGAAWSLVQSSASETDPDGALRSIGSSRDVVTLPNVLISASARAFVVISDPDRHSSGASLTSAFSRVAHAWSRQDPRMLFRSLPAPNPAILLYAGVRERLQRLAPFYAQDSHIYPVVVSDTLHWIVQLYSHAATYPLSLPERRVGDGASRYFRHAATAIINATTGHATLYAAPAADPVAQAWAERIPELIRDPRDVPGALAPLLPPPIDGILAQAAAFARYGSRGEAVIDGVLPVAHVADTLRGIPVPGALMLLPSLGPAPALVLPVLDSHDVMRALIIGVGGSNPRTYRLDLESVSRPWSELRRLLASVREGEAARDDAGGIEAGEFGVIPLPSETLPYQSIFRVRGTAMPTLAALSMVDRDSVVTAPGLAEALDVRSPARTTTDTLAFRSEVQSLYEQMRVALRNQDLTAFATAFDALGRVLAERRR